MNKLLPLYYYLENSDNLTKINLLDYLRVYLVLIKFMEKCEKNNIERKSVRKEKKK